MDGVDDMDDQELIEHARRLEKNTWKAARRSSGEATAARIECLQFLRDFAGSDSPFFEEASALPASANMIAPVLGSFADYVEAGLHGAISPQRQAQLDAVSDFLGQADSLLQEKGVHPAAPAMLVGATLEEFLRTWVEDEGLSLGGKKPGIDSYAGTLRTAGELTKQDMKDITGWAGTRNDAAHGNWDKVSDGKKIELMLEGVNLFMRKYGAE